jgi:hypothetical protein
LNFRLDDPRNQITGNDEKNIHADETAVNRRRFKMECDHRQHRDGAKPIDVFPIDAPHNHCVA